jgi:biotin operon repressor
MTKTSTEQDTHRLMHLLVKMDAGATASRQDLADALDMTPRAVSHLIVRAKTRYGVHVIHTPDGYALMNPGVFNMNAVRKFLKDQRIPRHFKL